jgi:integrase/recombinase XerD
VLRSTAKNTVINIGIPLFLETVVGQARTLTDQEFEFLLSRIQQRPHTARNALMLKLLHGAGLRVGEVAALTIADIVGADGRVRDQITLQPHQTKGRHQRTVWLNEKLKLELERYLQTVDRAGYLFKTQKRDHFTANTLQAVITGLYRRAGFAGCSSHTGRRSFITKLASAGISARVLQELAGHRNLATTQRYIDVTDAMKRGAVELA